MKKSLILVGLLSIGYAHAQQYDGKVGINTEEPSATLNVKSKANYGKNLELENLSKIKLATFLDNGRIGFNNPSPLYRLDIIGLSETYTDSSIALRAYRETSGGGGFDFYRARGTKDNPLVLQYGDIMGAVSTAGYSGKDFFSTSVIGSVITGEVTDGNLPTSIFFDTTNIGTKRNRIMTLHHTGNIGMGTITPENRLHVKADSNPVRLEGLQASTVATDKVVVVDASGVLKTVERASIGGGTQGIAQEADGVIGNELSGVIENGGLVTSGDGTTLSPLKVGMAPGTVVGQTLVWNGAKWEAQTPQNGASLNSITGGIRTVTHIAVAEWAKPDTFALIQTGDSQIQLPSPSSYTGRIIAVNNQYNNTVSYFATNQPKNAGSLESGKGHILMSDGNGWYIIGGSY